MELRLLNGLYSVLQQKWHAFAFARLLRKWAVSSDHRPPVSTTNTTRKARPPPPPGMWPLSCAALPPEPHRRAGSPSRTPTLPERRHGVDSQLGSLPQGQHVCDHLDPSSIEAIESSHAEVVHEGVCHRNPNLAAHLGYCTLKRKPPLSQNSCLGAHCSMMAKLVDLAATSACARGQGQRQVEASRKRKGRASILVILLVGIVVKTADAKNSRWECIKSRFYP